MSDLFSLAGRAALVTGASSGLGRHFAKVLARAGAGVALAARREDKLAQAAAEIVRDGGRAAVVMLDVLEPDSIPLAFAEAEKSFGGIDVLINNAGVASTVSALETTATEWDDVLDTNLRGAFLVAREFARRRIAANRPGAIVNICSILGERVAGGVAPYAVSKAGLAQLTRALALEWARHHIRVNALAPGYIDTELNHDFLTSDAGAAMVKRIPQRRAGQPGDLDGALLLLASDASRYMTGATVTVDGGHLVSTL